MERERKKLPGSSLCIPVELYNTEKDPERGRDGGKEKGKEGGQGGEGRGETMAMVPPTTPQNSIPVSFPDLIRTVSWSAGNRCTL